MQVPDPSSRPIGVILGQIGTPDAPTPAAVRRFLRQFLGDRRIIEANLLVRALVVGPVVALRAPRSARLYRRIWTASGSPLLVTVRAQAARLQEALGPAVRVAVGMRYGSPSIPAAVGDLLAA